MSKKYYDRLLVGTGQTSKEVQSAYGEKLMAKMGWKKGDGLGKTMTGITDCIQIKRRDENLGMGAEMETPGSKFKWNDQFWDDAYNSMAAKFSANVPKGQGPAKDRGDSFDKKIDIKSDSDSDSSDDDESSFDGEIVIEKSKKPLFKVPEKQKKKEKVEKHQNSKTIKKEKKDKKEKKEKKKDKAKK